MTAAEAVATTASIFYNPVPRQRKTERRVGSSDRLPTLDHPFDRTAFPESLDARVGYALLADDPSTTTRGAEVEMSDDAKWHWGEGNKYVIEAARAILLVNGAASISTLTFIGNLKLHPTNTLIFSMLLFAIAAMTSAMIFAFAYFAQLNYGNSNVKWAQRWHTWTYGVVLFSLALFVAGIALAANGFLHLPYANSCDLPV